MAYFCTTHNARFDERTSKHKNDNDLYYDNHRMLMLLNFLDNNLTNIQRFELFTKLVESDTVCNDLIKKAKRLCFQLLLNGLIIWISYGTDFLSIKT